MQASMVHPMRSPKHLSIQRRYIAPIFFRPNDIVTWQNDPNVVMKDVTSWSDSFIMI